MSTYHLFLPKSSKDLATWVVHYFLACILATKVHVCNQACLYTMLKNCPFLASFLFVFSIQYKVHVKLADDWIRILDLWCWKRFLYHWAPITACTVRIQCSYTVQCLFSCHSDMCYLDKRREHHCDLISFVENINFGIFCNFWRKVTTLRRLSNKSFWRFFGRILVRSRFRYVQLKNGAPA